MNTLANVLRLHFDRAEERELADTLRAIEVREASEFEYIQAAGTAADGLALFCHCPGCQE